MVLEKKWFPVAPLDSNMLTHHCRPLVRHLSGYCLVVLLGSNRVYCLVVLLGSKCVCVFGAASRFSCLQFNPCLASL
jgi:hypothetical protein